MCLAAGKKLGNSEAPEALVGRVKVVSSNAYKSEKEEDYKQQQALEFLQQHFYGDHRDRIPSESLGLVRCGHGFVLEPCLLPMYVALFIQS